MTGSLIVAAFFGLGIACFAQETPSAPPALSASPARTVRISFLPPPLEGTISLGIYDANGQLVRVLHQESKLDEFTVGADALVTKWDGKNDDGEDLPPGKYHARGFLDRKSTRLNSSHLVISYAVFCLKKNKRTT